VLREHERLARNLDDTLIRTAACAERELAGGECGDVHADDGEIAVFEFEDVGATLERRSLRSVGVRIGTEASSNHGEQPITKVIAVVNDVFGYERAMPKYDDYDKICKRVAELLSEERERIPMSMTQLAAKAGLAQSAISYFEGDNDRAPNFKTLLRIADALEVDLGKIVQRAIKDIRGGKR